MAQLNKSDDESLTVVVTPQTESESNSVPEEKHGVVGMQHDTAEPTSDTASTKDDAKAQGKGSKQVYLKGMVPESKTLYAKFDDRGNRSWTEKKPADFEEAAEGEETQKFAIIVRKRKLDNSLDGMDFPNPE
jgi:hypothetical protein